MRQLIAFTRIRERPGPGARRLVLLAALLSALFPIGAGALSSDRDQALELEADRGQVDNIRRVSSYQGRVVLRQGSMRITGEEMEVYYTQENKLRLVIMKGSPVGYRQLPDDSDQYDEAYARQMKYYAQEGRIVLMEDAVMKQENIRFRGARIEYDTVNSIIIAQGKDEDADAVASCPPNEECDGRIELIIEPERLREASE